MVCLGEFYNAMSLARNAYALAYQISPILFTGGIASQVPGGVLPIVAITQGTSAAISAVQNTGNLIAPISTDLLEYFAHFEPVAGSTLIVNDIARYPFLNQSVAANAIITMPNTLSMLMKAPPKGELGYVSRLMTFTALKSLLDAHIQAGGTFTVATPAYLYQGLILKGLTDVTPPIGDNKQVQMLYRWDFEQPLLTQSAVTGSYNAYLTKVSAAAKVAL